MPDTDFAYDVFLSHNKAQKDWTRRLGRRLRNDGFEVWLDEWVTPRFAGTSWIQLLRDGVKESRKVILVWSEEFFNNEWPQLESAIIQLIDPIGTQGRIIPILQSPCSVPEDWRFREALNFIDCSDDGVEFEFRYQQLLHNIDNSRPFVGDFELFKKRFSNGISLVPDQQVPAEARREDWEKITPKELIPAIAHIQKEFQESAWKYSVITEKLCYAALHPQLRHVDDLAAYEQSFSIYRVILGSQAQREFDSLIRKATPSSIFTAYFEAFRKGLAQEVSRLFDEILQIGLANSKILSEHPVEWAKKHLTILINRKGRGLSLWIKSVCDEQDYSKALNPNQNLEDFMFWKDWRAPKLIYMRPSGNLAYNQETAWVREDEALTEKLLNGLSKRFTEFLQLDLDDIVGGAYVRLAKSGANQSAPLSTEKSGSGSKYQQ